MWKRVLLSAVLVLIGAQGAFADVWVNPYHRSDGTYVQGHWRSDPDGDPSNNWSTKGNVNPHNGKPGYKNIIDYRRN